MTTFIKRIKQGINDLSVDRVKDAFSKRSVPISIPAEWIKEMLEQGPLNGVKEVAVDFKEDYLEVSGKAKKWMMTITFVIKLKPAGAEQRNLYLTVLDIFPVNSEWINKKVFSREPLVSYHEKKVELQLNEFEAVRKVPLGQINSWSISEGKLWVYLGL
jgi:hypothetical protein